MEYNFETLCRLLALAARSDSDEKALIRGRGVVVSGRVIVEDEADDDTEVEIITDMVVSKNDERGLKGGQDRGCRRATKEKINDDF